MPDPIGRAPGPRAVEAGAALAAEPAKPSAAREDRAAETDIASLRAMPRMAGIEVITAVIDRAGLCGYGVRPAEMRPLDLGLPARVTRGAEGLAVRSLERELGLDLARDDVIDHQTPACPTPTTVRLFAPDLRPEPFPRLEAVEAPREDGFAVDPSGVIVPFRGAS